MILRNGPRFRDWPTARHPRRTSEMVESVDGITERLLEDAGDTSDIGRWTTVADLIDHMTPQGRTKAIQRHRRELGDHRPGCAGRHLQDSHDIADRHRRFPKQCGAWTPTASPSSTGSSASTVPWSGRTTRCSVGGPRKSTQQPREGRGLQRRRVEAVTGLLCDGVDAITQLAQDVEGRPQCRQCRGARPLSSTTRSWTSGSDDPKVRDVAYGLIGVRAQSREWLGETAHKRPTRLGGCCSPSMQRMISPGPRGYPQRGPEAYSIGARSTRSAGPERL